MKTTQNAIAWFPLYVNEPRPGEFRYYVDNGGVGDRRLQTFDSSIYKTEKAIRQHLDVDLQQSMVRI